ncbi:MAG: methyltransferase domain-containing protein [Planctomycetaceae bacterium]|nr:methyltransferase domain-containing protein [Planctomycetaceae bacterium]
MSTGENEQLWLDLRTTPALLQEIATSSLDDMKLQQVLRERYPQSLVIAALQLRDARKRAAVKFSLAERMWLERVGVEQSTSEVVARHKARRFADCQQVWDLCCGTGGDAIAIAEMGVRVTAVDCLPLATLRTAWNADVYGVGDQIETVTADVMSLSFADGHVHLDPDRRPAARRVLRLEDYVPPLDFMQELTQAARGGAIKLSPASNFGGKFPDCEVELISLDGECKEATIWFGDRRTETDWRATLLPEGVSLTGDPWLARADRRELGRYLYDPDPAVVRAGLVDVLGEQTGLARLDEAEEYFTSEVLIETPFARPFEVLAECANNQRELRNMLRSHAAGQLEIKCRHVPIDVNRFRKQLPLTGTEPLVLFVARLAGKTRAVLTRRP